MKDEKPFRILTKMVWGAYQNVKWNKGAAGIDLETIEEFEKDLDNNIYKIWNRMSSGTYFPPPVRTVAIPKGDGKERLLGIPTVADRVAQTVVKKHLEPWVEPHFHPDSYGYRPNKSAHDALATTRKRCWYYDWVVDLDIKGFFDNLDHELVIESVKKFKDERWILLYIERWLKAPAQSADGTLIPRNKGTPQGGVISPLLANIFLHLAFDDWMGKRHPNMPFERYADDIVVHCKTEKQAKYIKECIKNRLAQWKLQLHPEKTKIAYCKDKDRKESYPNVKFDFLGYTFRPRLAKNKYAEHFVSFIPAVSNKAKKSMNKEMRGWKVHLLNTLSLQEIAKFVNPIMGGWIDYYGKFYKSALALFLRHFDETLRRWVTRKYKRFRRNRTRARKWLRQVADRQPNLFAHWRYLGIRPAVR